MADGSARAAVDVVVGRIADPPPRPHVRFLVDRLWPRGVRREQASWDEWLRDAAPSAELRRWYDHDPSRFGGFRERYLVELEAQVDTPTLRRLLETARRQPVALLTATRDLEHSQAPVLAAFVRQRLRQGV